MPSASAELTLFAWTLSKGDKNPLRRLMAKRQRFINKFKRDEVRLWKSSGRPAAAVACELGLRCNHFVLRGRPSWKPMMRARSLAKAVVPTHGYDGRLRAFERERHFSKSVRYFASV